MTTPNLVLEEALRIAELGYKVLPCSQDKKPILTGWPEKATADAEQIKAWFSNTDYLVAVKTGPETNLFVLDVDPKGTGWLAENQHRMLCERIHQTRRGQHFLYGFSAALKDMKTNTAGKIHAGIDTRGEGGCQIWWPAHGLATSGDLTDLTEPPPWLVNALAGSAEISKTDTDVIGDFIEEGKRDDSLTSYCGWV